MLYSLLKTQTTSEVPAYNAFVDLDYIQGR